MTNGDQKFIETHLRNAIFSQLPSKAVFLAALEQAEIKTTDQVALNGFLIGHISGVIKRENFVKNALDNISDSLMLNKASAAVRKSQVNSTLLLNMSSGEAANMAPSTQQMQGRSVEHKEHKEHKGRSTVATETVDLFEEDSPQLFRTMKTS